MCECQNKKNNIIEFSLHPWWNQPADASDISQFIILCIKKRNNATFPTQHFNIP